MIPFSSESFTAKLLFIEHGFALHAIVIFILLCSVNMAHGSVLSDDNSLLTHCARTDDSTGLTPASASKAAYLPDVEVSYRYHPRQSGPSIVLWWSSDIWPVDSFWENDGLNAASKNIFEGERHSFWINMRWDFESLVFGEKEKYLQQALRTRAEARVHRIEVFNRLQEKLFSLFKQGQPKSLQARVSQAAEKAIIFAQAAHFCAETPSLR